MKPGMVMCVIFDPRNETYRKIHGSLPVGRTYPEKQKLLYKYPV